MRRCTGKTRRAPRRLRCPAHRRTLFRPVCAAPHALSLRSLRAQPVSRRGAARPPVASCAAFACAPAVRRTRRWRPFWRSGSRVRTRSPLLRAAAVARGRDPPQHKENVSRACLFRLTQVPRRAGSLGLPTKLQEAFATIRSLDEEDAGAARRLGAPQRAPRHEKAQAAPRRPTREALSPRTRSVASRHRGHAGGARRLRRRAGCAAAADGGTAQSALRRCRGRGGGYRRRRRAHLRARHHQGALS